MKLSIIIPVYNEKNTILKLIKIVENVDIGGIRKEIIIVDDGSTDGTKDILRKIKKHKVFFHSSNQGKGSAIRTGIKYVTGSIVLIQDADLEYDPNDYYKLIKPIVDNKAKVVYGSRLLGKHINMYFHHYLGNHLLTVITNLLYRSKITDMETCYKVFRRDVLFNLKLKSKGFEIEPEITAKLLKKGCRIYEVPISFTNPRKFIEGKKINYIDGIKAVYYLLKYRFTN